MRIKNLDHYKIDAKFLIQEEPETLSLQVNCMTPRKINNYVEALNNDNSNFDDLVKANCDVVTGWEGVVDEDGNEVEFDKEKLQDLQYDYFGLADAIAVAIFNETKELREKNSSVSEDLSAE